MIYLDV